MAGNPHITISVDDRQLVKALRRIKLAHRLTGPAWWRDPVVWLSVGLAMGGSVVAILGAL